MTNSVSKKITAQMIFDAAWQAFIVEGKPPAQEIDDYGQWVCRYLTRDGRKCAVGLCIPDGHPYQDSNISLNGLIGEEMSGIAEETLFGEEFHRDSSIRETMQGYLHDMNAQEGKWIRSPEQLEAIYRNFAMERKLTIPGEEPNACSVE